MPIKKKKVQVMDSIKAKGQVIVHRYIMLGREPESHMTALEKMDMARKGISKKSLETMKEKTGLGYERLARTLSVTKATLINKKRAEKFGPTLSESIVGLADIYSYGYEVLERKNNLINGCPAPIRLWVGEPPVDVAGSQFGPRRSKNIIGRIDYGVYS